MPAFSIQSAIEKTGVKQAQSKIHNFLRTVLLLGFVFMIFLSIKLENPKQTTLDDISNIVRPGTIMYNMVDEMDDDVKCRYLNNLQSSIEPGQTRLQKYINGVQLSLIAGIVSEYIINGNSAKPLGILAKTVVYSTAYTMVSL
jgi:hypothetical protein